MLKYFNFEPSFKLAMQEIGSLNPLVVSGMCDPNKSPARHHRSLKLDSNLNYLNIDQLLLLQGSEFGYSESD